MKHNNKFRVFILIAISILLISCGTTQTAAEKIKQIEKEGIIDKQIENLEFKFLADFVYPISYPSFSLSPYYNVIVSPDTIQSHLPYFGRAYR